MKWYLNLSILTLNLADKEPAPQFDLPKGPIPGRSPEGESTLGGCLVLRAGTGLDPISNFSNSQRWEVIVRWYPLVNVYIAMENHHI